MPSKGLKPAIARPSARDALAAADAVAQQAGLPPAALIPRGPSPAQAVTGGAADEELVQVNIRVRRGLGDQLADRAREEGKTQKVLICEALATAGFQVHPEDLRPTAPPRRRGSS